jgi:F-type H+-transporting ATPase subunit epsilon
MYNKFNLEIITPEKQFFSGEVEEIIVTTPDGEMGILNNHYPTVAGLVPGSIRILVDGNWREAANGEGFIEVLPDKTTVIVQTAEWPEELDKARIEANILKAEERIRQKKSMLEFRMGKMSLARAFARLKVLNRNKGE